MEFKNQKAIYLQIADWVCDQILQGRYGEDDKLPSVRECAAEVEVNVNTVARTFEWLQLHGVVQARRGMGNYVAPGAATTIEAIRKEEFFHDQLPAIFREMHTLGITLEEVEREYRNFQTSPS